MSITSSHQNPTWNQFLDLLLRFPQLASWLMEMHQSRAEPRAEALLPAFLLECACQGVASDAYPFTCKDRGLADLRRFLRDAQGESKTRTARVSLSSAAQLEPEGPGAIPVALDAGVIDGTPVTPTTMKPSGEIDNTLMMHHTPVGTGGIDKTPLMDLMSGKPGEIDDTPVVHQPRRTDGVENDLQAQATDLSAHIPENMPTPRIQTTSRETTDREQEIVEGEADFAEQLTKPVFSLTAPEDEIENEQAEHAQFKIKADISKTDMDWISAQKTPRLVAGSKRVRIRRPRTRRERLISLALLILILGAILVPAGFLLNFGISAYNTYRDVSSRAHSAVDHLLTVKTIFSGGGSHLTSVFDVAKLQHAEREFVASGQDFQQLQQQLQHSSTLHTVVTYLPQYREPLRSAEVASAIGIDIAKIGQIAITHAIQLAPSFNGPLLSVSQKPLLTQPMLDTIGTTLDQALPLLNDIQARAQTLSLNTLPISAHEKDQVASVLHLLPQAVSDLGQVHNLLGTAGWLLGVNQPRTFLVQTMDRAELRGTGGFTGQYGNLTINAGRVEPFSLKDISLVEYAYNSNTYGQRAPQQYRSWWPFANWGMRDSNVSADFPTSAQLALQLYQHEVGTQADGLISFTPVAIEHILAILGPLQVPGYNVTATAQNLEDLLHYYQLDNNGILQQYYQQPGDQQTSTRKRFTNTLASLLMSKVRSSSPDELLAIAHQMFADLKTKDLQVYFTDPGAEGLLMRYGYAAQMDRSTTHDGVYVVQENLSVSKASQYVQTTMHDTVTLNSQGGATHVLQIRLVYNQAGPVYGYDTYFDYLRVYVPESSQLLWGDGFEGKRPLCGGGYGACPINGPYPNGELTCPAGQYQPGATPPYLVGGDGSTWEPLRAVGGPTNTASDEPGRAMYGGWIIIPKNCTMNVTLSWYVPPMSQQPYTLLVQRQAGTFPELDLTILPSATNCASLHTAGLHFDDILVEDRSFTPASSGTQKQMCYPTQGT